jgi:hypothetical protein
MSASVHSHQSAPPRGSAYCVDCYADGGKVSVATRMFGDDELCERHYLALCKDMGVEPDVIMLSEAQSAKQMAQPSPIKKIRQAPTRRPEAGLKPAGHPVRESVAVRVRSGVSRPESTEAHGGNQSAVVTIEQSFPSDSDLAEAARSLNSQRPGSTVAPAAGDAADRAHKPDSAVAAPASRSFSAAPTQSPTRKESTMAKLCACGCGQELKPGTTRTYKMGHKPKNGKPKRLCACGCGSPLVNRHPYIKGHNKTAGAAAPAKRGRPRKSTDAPPQQTNGHAPILPPVALLNGNGREHKVVCSVSELSMDRIWTRLTPEEKAQLLFPQEAPEEPQHA